MSPQDHGGWARFRISLKDVGHEMTYFHQIQFSLAKLSAGMPLFNKEQDIFVTELFSSWAQPIHDNLSQIIYIIICTKIRLVEIKHIWI